MSNGFVIIASLKRKYLLSAMMCYDSIKDHWPEANITLFVDSTVYDKDLLEGYNVVHEDVPSDERAKLWALDKSPYDITAYLDADTIVVHDDIQTIFDQLGEHDMLFTRIREYNSNRKGYMENVGYEHHGGVFLYNKNAHDFVGQWWEDWDAIKSNEDFKLKYPDIPVRMSVWDQFYLWNLIHNTDHGLSIGFFEEDARWNFVVGYKAKELNGKGAIIEHYTLK